MERVLDVALQIKPLVLLNEKRQLKIDNILKPLKLSAATVRRVEEVFISELNKGIRQEPSSLQMETTYVSELLDGTEEGLYLGLDLGGTNLRMLLLELINGAIVREEVKRYSISPDLKLGSATRLFDYLAECIIDFVTAQGLQDVELPLGFTFSFPMIQHSLDIGVLVTWTKTFNCPDAVNEDVVKLLREALARLGCTNVKVLAILNDTTGTLVQGSMLDSNARIGLILGTGSNACYLERTDRVEHWETERHGESDVIIDIEWGAFGDNGVLDFIKTDYDRENDANSLIVNSFTFEKYISGEYLGEIVRVLLLKLIKEGLLFPGNHHIPKSLLVRGNFTTDMMSYMEQDYENKVDVNTMEIFMKFGILPDAEDVRIVHHVCEVVSNRAAILVSTCLAVLLKRINRKFVTIAVDGSLYKHHPRLGKLIKHYIHLLAPDHEFGIIHAEDGSGKGAALVAAIAKRLKKRLY